MSAESAVMGRFMGVIGWAMSTMTTEFAAPVSRTQMNFSDSIVRLVKEMFCRLMPEEVSCSWGKGGAGRGQDRADEEDLGLGILPSDARRLMPARYSPRPPPSR
jgi:hypothetical protein